ncbi:bifunctional pyr operon transcriptional regulator/uracil phosphoribosyltransferase PyrR [Candidatus Formimonas warabiya]|uniref:Bifunctional protein PyrR n=1 Tax=Formimonas warabiya TaxID=1761012 RepID=A0A3G1KQY1_FORW1|nr:bifunctional pyr operon transcriptional regulator/uracil phosphoribosyltransferase PyrR [Candidatus Formimonas warabiya]ATW24868.1 bifunctional pyr operon transcriptional regulator/uracil phosphoribosyltransferase [Candidatus Formimonas warabiya]
MKLIEKTQIMDKDAMRRALTRIAHEIIERNNGVENLCFIGIRSRGVPLAERLTRKVKEIEGKDLPIGVVDITLHRDDLALSSGQPVVSHTDVSFPVSGKTVILVDDVLFTGRTTRAALDAIFELGRPASIQLAVLVDRGHRELPIRPDYVGKNVPTSLKEIVSVYVGEIDKEDKVIIQEIADEKL